MENRPITRYGRNAVFLRRTHIQSLNLRANFRQYADILVTEKKKTVKKAEPKKVVKNETSKPEMSVAGQGNVNEKIKELHKQGKSVLEISKQLNIGQGEVKLVLALYGGDNK